MYKSIDRAMTADELKLAVPLSNELKAKRNSALGTVRDILVGKDKRKLFIVGPCSADDPSATIDYAERLSRCAEEIRESIFVVLRLHTCKPRTRGGEYLGLQFSPECDGKTDITGGLYASRKLTVAVAENSGLFGSDELLYPESFEYLSDVLVYSTVGARSSSDQLHKFAASAADIPVGIKNAPDGNPRELIGSVMTAQMSCEYLFKGMHVVSDGNHYAHAVLRGINAPDGKHIRNYGKEYVAKYMALHCENKLVCPAVIIDANHSNSGKVPERQIEVVNEVLGLCGNDPDYGKAIKGFMLESYIVGGRQEKRDVYGVSVTDACLSMEDTEHLLYAAAERLSGALR